MAQSIVHHTHLPLLLNSIQRALPITPALFISSLYQLDDCVPCQAGFILRVIMACKQENIPRLLIRIQMQGHHCRSTSPGSHLAFIELHDGLRGIIFAD